MSRFLRSIILLFCLGCCLSAAAQDRAASEDRPTFGAGFSPSLSYTYPTLCVGMSAEGVLYPTKHIEFAAQVDGFANVPFLIPTYGLRYTLLAGYRAPVSKRVAFSFLVGPHFFNGQYYSKDAYPGSFSIFDNYETEHDLGFGVTFMPRMEFYSASHFCLSAAPFVHLCDHTQTGLSLRFLFGHFRNSDARDERRRRYGPMGPRAYRGDPTY